jgi:hypothetical protein
MEARCESGDQKNGAEGIGAKGGSRMRGGRVRTSRELAVQAAPRNYKRLCQEQCKKTRNADSDPLNQGLGDDRRALAASLHGGLTVRERTRTTRKPTPR